MKIFGPDQNPYKKGVGGTGKAGEKGKAAQTAGVSPKDTGATPASAQTASEKILVSDLGREVAKIHEQIKKTPDVRAEKVKELKDKIDSGSYYVSSDKIANKIIEDVVKNSQGK
ncbi:MAG: flagellar biosynthesis anti-sigma factor FlgM [Nitrospinae bacterium]|nr:flagellar biosynthesis anti-sigma factor FlgM [Nitrospinota bacterium]